MRSPWKLLCVGVTECTGSGQVTKKLENTMPRHCSGSIAIKLHDLDTEEHRQGVGSKCLVPQLFERRFVSMVSLDVSLVGLAWSPDFVILGGTHMESRFCQFVFRCGVHSSGRVWCILSCVWLSGCWLCDHLGVGRQALHPPKSSGYFFMSRGFIGGRGIARPPSSSHPR